MTLWNLLLFGLWIFFTSNPALILDSQLPLEYIRCLFLVFFRYRQVLFHFLWQLLLKPGIRLSLFVYWILSLIFFKDILPQSLYIFIHYIIYIYRYNIYNFQLLIREETFTLIKLPQFILHFTKQYHFPKCNTHLQTFREIGSFSTSCREISWIRL